MTNSMELVCGIDAGNRYLKAVTTNKEIVCPSMVGQGRDDLLRMNPDANESAMILKYGDGTYFVGDLADRESENVSLALDESKVEHTNTIVLILAAVVMLAPPDVRWMDVNAVVGMPIDHFRNKETRQKLVDILTANVHNVYVGGKPRLVRFKSVMPFPEGAAELFTVLPAHPEYKCKDYTVGNIHVGAWRTSYVVLEGMEYRDRLSGTLPLGMHQALHMVKTNRMLHEIERVAVKNEELFRSLEESRDLKAKQIVDNLKAKWPHVDDFDAIYITGMGAGTVQKYLPQSRVMPKPKNIDGRILANAPHEQMATARGLYDVGVIRYGLPTIHIPTG